MEIKKLDYIQSYFDYTYITFLAIKQANWSWKEKKKRKKCSCTHARNPAFQWGAFPITAVSRRGVLSQLSQLRPAGFSTASDKG